MADPSNPDAPSIPREIKSFQARLGSDPSFRSLFLSDPKSALMQSGVELDTAGMGRPIVVGDADARAAFVTERVVSNDVATSPLPIPWPYRCYELRNWSSRRLNLEAWWHSTFRIGYQEKAVAVEPRGSGMFIVVWLIEKVLNKCNLERSSFLVRDLGDNSVLAESWTITCGPTINRWTVVDTEVPPGVKCSEEHPTMS